MRSRLGVAGVLLLGLLAVTLAASPAAAHSGDGETIAAWTFPAWVVWFSGAFVVTASFAVVGAFLSRAEPGGLAAAAPDARPANGFPVGVGNLLGLALYLATCVFAFLPSVDSTLPRAVVWLGLWALLPLASYLFAGASPWNHVDPFRALAPAVGRLRFGHAPLPYPTRLGAWPSVIGLLAVMAIEVSGSAFSWDATAIARLMLTYLFLTVAGMLLFGADTWLAHGEVFGRAMRVWGAFAPIVRGSDGRLRFVMPGAGLRTLPVRDMSEVSFLVAILYAVNFDSFLATSGGAAGRAAMAAVTGDAVAVGALAFVGFLLFMAAFMACAHAIRDVAESSLSRKDLAARFAASLVPIAVVYHLAHNVPYLIHQAPVLLGAVLDPLATGWTGLPFNPVPFDAAMIPWIGGLQVFVIIAGHVGAVVVAHDLAFRAFTSRVQAIRSELPITALMVAYTVVGLWLLSNGAHGLTGVGA